MEPSMTMESPIAISLSLLRRDVPPRSPLEQPSSDVGRERRGGRRRNLWLALPCGTAAILTLFTCAALAQETGSIQPGPAQAADAAAPQAADSKPAVTLGAFVDGYYAWDFDQPPAFDRAYTTQPARHAEFNVNLAFVEAKLEE